MNRKDLIVTNSLLGIKQRLWDKELSQLEQIVLLALKTCIKVYVLHREERKDSSRRNREKKAVEASLYLNGQMREAVAIFTPVLGTFPIETSWDVCAEHVLNKDSMTHVNLQACSKAKKCVEHFLLK